MKLTSMILLTLVGQTLYRLSAGIESVEDLWADLDGALRAALG